MNQSPPGDLTPQDMAYIQARSRQRILQTREEALLCRRQYDEQLELTGDVGRDLHADLAAAMMSLHSRLRLYRDDVDEYPEIDALRREAIGSDEHVADNPETPAAAFADGIDALDAVAHDLGFVPEVER
jgi:hypothetical protein